MDFLQILYFVKHCPQGCCRLYCLYHTAFHIFLGIFLFPSYHFPRFSSAFLKLIHPYQSDKATKTQGVTGNEKNEITASHYFNSFFRVSNLDLTVSNRSNNTLLYRPIRNLSLICSFLFGDITLFRLQILISVLQDSGP